MADRAVPVPIVGGPRFAKCVLGAHARTNMKLRPRAVGAAMALLLVATACGAQPQSSSQGTTSSPVSDSPASQAIDEPALAEQLTIGQLESLTFVDPQRTYLSTEAAIWHSLYDALIFQGPDLQIAPGLAKSWEQISDTEWQLELQEGVTFQNGEVFNAETVKANVDRVVAPGFQDFPYLDALAGAEVVDDYTVVIETDTLFPTLPQLLAQFTMIPPLYMDEVGIEGFNSAPVGTGPYRFVEWVHDSHITLEANPDYWNDVHAPTYERVTWRFIPEASSAVSALRAGELDILKGVPPDSFEAIDEDPELDAVWTPSIRTVFFRFFPESPQGGGEPLNDIRVRRAINHAIDVDEMLDTILGGRGSRTASIMSPIMPGYDETVEPYAYDPDLALELLEEAGYADGFDLDFGTWSAGPAPLPLDLAQAAAGYLAEVGIRAQVVPRDVGTSLEMQTERTSEPLQLWSKGVGDCRYKFYGPFHPDSVQAFMSDEETGSLLDELDVTADPAERDALCSQLQQYVHDQAFIVPLLAPADLYGRRSDVVWEPRPDELILPWEVRPAE